MINYKKQPFPQILLLSLTLWISLAGSCDPGGKRTKADIKKEIEKIIHSLTDEELESMEINKKALLDECNKELSKIDQGAKNENKQDWGERIKKLSEELNKAECQRNTLANNPSATPAQKSSTEKHIKASQLVIEYAKLARREAGK